MIEFYRWDNEESDYADHPDYVEIVKTTDMYDFEKNAKAFIELSRKIAKISSKRPTFTELMKKLEEEGVEFGI